MFDFVRNRKRVVQIILALLLLPFALFGIDSYQRSGSQAGEVARVGGAPITLQEFERARQNQQDRMRQMLGRGFDAAMFDTPEAREGLLDNLISQRLLATYVAKGGLAVGNDELQAAIANIEAFQENGKFSLERYQQLLRANGMTPVGFQESFRQDLAVQRLNGALAESAIASKALAKSFMTLQTEQREAAELAFAADAYVSQVKLAPDAAEAYYKANAREFEVPEQVRAEYVVLNPEMVAAQEVVTADEVRQYYDKNFGQRASERAAAREKIDGLLAQARKSPDSFAELAKANSQDPGSAAQGGDLGFFGRGMMVKPFEDAAFKLKPGEISSVVESDFGFHVIKLAEVKKGAAGEERRASHILINAPAGAKTFEQSRAEIEAEIRKQRVSGQFGRVADKFQVLADQDNDSLKPFVDQFKLAVQSSGWIAKGAPNPQAGLLASPKMIDALFKPELLKAKRATEAVEAAPNVLVVARVVEHKPAATRTLDEARAEILRKLTQNEARALARKAGVAKLEELKRDPNAAAKWPAAKPIGRDNAGGLPRESVQAVFRADATKLPAFAGTDTPNGYSVFRITKVLAAPEDPQRTQQLEAALARLEGRDQSAAFVSGLRERAKVEINRANLEKKAN
jgi:peptidyl-prolyl cis-trans isomerase D